MTGRTTCTVDTSGLAKSVSAMAGMLFGRGATPGEGQQMLMVETGQLAGRMGDAAGPSTKAKGDKVITGDMKQYLAVLPFSNLGFQESESYADFTWLYASPHALVGINDEDNLKGAGNDGALEVFRAARKLAPRGSSYEELGSRGKQKIMRLNRVGVTLSQFNYVRRSITSSVGQLRAACYRIAKRYVPSKRVPGWLLEQFPAVEANGKSTLAESGLNTPAAVIEFAITSPGVVSNPRLVTKFQGAIEGARISAQAKLAKLARGAKYVWETGQVYFAGGEN